MHRVMKSKAMIKKAIAPRRHNKKSHENTVYGGKGQIRKRENIIASADY